MSPKSAHTGVKTVQTSPKYMKSKTQKVGISVEKPSPSESNESVVRESKENTVKGTVSIKLSGSNGET